MSIKTALTPPKSAGLRTFRVSVLLPSLFDEIVRRWREFPYGGSLADFLVFVTLASLGDLEAQSIMSAFWESNADLEDVAAAIIRQAADSQNSVARRWAKNKADEI